MQVTIHVKDRVAKELLGTGRKSATARSIEKIVARKGLTIEPLHRGSDDPELRKHFYVRVPDEPTGEQLSAELRRVAGIEAAYLKGRDALPG